MLGGVRAHICNRNNTGGDGFARLIQGHRELAAHPGTGSRFGPGPLEQPKTSPLVQHIVAVCFQCGGNVWTAIHTWKHRGRGRGGTVPQGENHM